MTPESFTPEEVVALKKVASDRMRRDAAKAEVLAVYPQLQDLDTLELLTDKHLRETSFP